LCNFVGNLPPSFDDYTGTPENLDKETWEFQPSPKQNNGYSTGKKAWNGTMKSRTSNRERTRNSTKA